MYMCKKWSFYDQEDCPQITMPDTDNDGHLIHDYGFPGSDKIDFKPRFISKNSKINQIVFRSFIFNL